MVRENNSRKFMQYFTDDYRERLCVSFLLATYRLISTSNTHASMIARTNERIIAGTNQ